MTIVAYILGIFIGLTLFMTLPMAIKAHGSFKEGFGVWFCIFGFSGIVILAASIYGLMSLGLV